MHAEIINGLSALKLEANRIVIYDKFDNPIAAVIELEDGRYVATTAAQKKFNQIINALGIKKTIIVDTINAAKLVPLI